MVCATEQAHTYGQEHRAGLRRAHGEGVRVHHAFDLGITTDLALQVRPPGQLDQMGAAVRPGFAAIQTAHEPTDFHPGIDLIGIARISRHADEACVKAHLHPLRLFGIG